MIYADYNATAPCAPGVEKAVEPYLGTKFGNPSSVHSMGDEAREALERSREAVAGLIGSGPAEVVFTGGGTESCFLALIGALMVTPRPRRVFISAVEHSAVRETSTLIEALGAEVLTVPVDSEGQIDREYLLTNDLHESVVSMMFANNETGVIFPVAELAPQLRARGAVVHCDAIQGVGKLPISFQVLGVDLMSISGHKFGAPKGVGALILRDAARWSSPISGGGQEGGRRGGTQALPAIVGMGVAATVARKRAREGQRLANLRDSFEKEILQQIEGVSINGQKVERLPNTSSVLIKNILAGDLVRRLGQREICVSAGSACSSGKTESSHVLRAMKRSVFECLGTVRVSLGWDTTAAEVDQLVTAFVEEVAGLRRASSTALKGMLS